MVCIPGGSFLMGSSENEKDRRDSEGPQHAVQVSPFYLGKYPVTQAQWRAVASLPLVGRYLDPDPAKFKGDDRPVERVTWDDAVEFCQRLSNYTGKRYRLPSEAEWEYACRARTRSPFFFGDRIDRKQAKFLAWTKLFSGTSPVGQYPANAFGLCDMHGSVWEWCEDVWHQNYKGAPTDGSAWIEDGDPNRRLLRGGSWLNFPRHCRSAFRAGISRDDRINDLGFRVCCVSPLTAS